MIASATEKKAPQPFARGQLQRAVPHAIEQPGPPTHAKIAQRAYDIYVADGRQQGQCEAHWYRAEKQLLHESQAAPQPEAHFGY
jgi:hypothetical protein